MKKLIELVSPTWQPLPEQLFTFSSSSPLFDMDEILCMESSCIDYRICMSTQGMIKFEESLTNSEHPYPYPLTTKPLRPYVPTFYASTSTSALTDSTPTDPDSTPTSEQQQQQLMAGFSWRRAFSAYESPSEYVYRETFLYNPITPKPVRVYALLTPEERKEYINALPHTKDEPIYKPL